jgi:maltose alpha-D-glucosyltransferase/alpha-amylase
MQWTPDQNGGFSTARKRAFIAPIVSTGPLRYACVNVADADRDPNSLLNWLRRAVRARRERSEFGERDWDALETGDPAVIALRYHASFGNTLAIHNLSGDPRRVKLHVEPARRSVEVFANRAYEGWQGSMIELDAYGYRWIAAPSQ